MPTTPPVALCLACSPVTPPLLSPKTELPGTCRETVVDQLASPSPALLVLVFSTNNLPLSFLDQYNITFSIAYILLMYDVHLEVYFRKSGLERSASIEKDFEWFREQGIKIQFSCNIAGFLTVINWLCFWLLIWFITVYCAN